MSIPKKQVRELDNLRKTIEDYQKLRVPSTSPVLFKSQDDVIASPSRPVLTPSDNLEASNCNYHVDGFSKININDVSTTSTPKRQTLRLAGALQADKRKSSGSLSSMSSHVTNSSQSSESSSSHEGEPLNYSKNGTLGRKKRWLPIKKSTRSSKSSQSSGVHDCDVTTSKEEPINSPISRLASASKPAIDEQSYNQMVIQLQEKDRMLTDAKLQILMSQHQLHHMQDHIEQMQHDMELLRLENERLQSFSSVNEIQSPEQRTAKPSYLSSSSLSRSSSLRRSTLNSKIELVEGSSTLRRPTSTPFVITDAPVSINFQKFAACTLDSQKVKKLVSLENTQSLIKFVVKSSEDSCKNNKSSDHSTKDSVVIGRLPVPRNYTWFDLDKITNQVFNDYCTCIDGNSKLGLSSTSIAFYQVGEQTRMPGSKPPQLLPCAFIIGDVDSIYLSLKDGSSGAFDYLSFKILTPKKVLQNYVFNLMKKKQVILHGPKGSGKRQLAKNLANFLLKRSRKQLTWEEQVFSYDLNQEEEEVFQVVREKLIKIINDKTNKGIPTPYVLVIILHNIPNCSKTNLFHKEIISLLNVSEGEANCPYIIGTSNKLNTNELTSMYCIKCEHTSLHVKDYLSRFLTQKLLSVEISKSPGKSDDNFKKMLRVVTWLPLCWHRLNRSLSNCELSEATIGTSCFESCPLDFSKSCEWFLKLWNDLIVPNIRTCLKKQSTALKANLNFIDPLEWIVNSFPWNTSEIGYNYSSQLKKILDDGNININCRNSMKYSEKSPAVPPKDVETEIKLNNEVFCSPSFINMCNSPTILPTKSVKTTQNNQQLSWNQKLDEPKEISCKSTPIWQSRRDAKSIEHSSEILQRSYF